MKMKKACELTALTERAIRLYLARNLLAPRQVNGTLDFSDEDIARLRDIALLRQMGFSVEQIFTIIHRPESIADILRLRLNSAQEDIRCAAHVRDTLLSIQGQSIPSLAELASLLRTQRPSMPSPDFGRFDEISEEDRRLEADSAAQGLSRLERWQRWKRRLICAGAAAAVLLIAALTFLDHTRLEGNVSPGPFTVQQIHADGTITINLSDPQAIDRLGSSVITVPCRIYGRQPQEGDLIENGTQLAISLTNGDLLRLGVSPFHAFRTPSTEVNAAWLKWILHALFRDSSRDEAVLWVGEISGLYPLFPVEP